MVSKSCRVVFKLMAYRTQTGRSAGSVESFLINMKTDQEQPGQPVLLSLFFMNRKTTITPVKIPQLSISISLASQLLPGTKC